MPEPRQNRGQFKTALQRESQHRRPTTEPDIAATDIKAEVERQFGKELAAASVLTNDVFLADIAQRANLMGLPRQAVERLLADVQTQLSLQANVTERQDLTAKKSAAGFVGKVGYQLYESSKVFGRYIGMGASVAERKRQLTDERDYMEAVTRESLERQIMHHRFDQYMADAPDGLKQLLGDYLQGQIGYYELIDHPDYLAGVRTLVHKIRIGDQFVIGDPPHQETLTIAGDNEREAVRQHLGFVLRSELIQLAEAKRLQVVSSELDRAEAAHWLQIPGKLFFSGSTWGMISSTGAKVAIGGVLVAGGAAGWAAVAGTAVAGAAGGALAGYVRERWFNSKERAKQRRLDAAVGASEGDEVKSAQTIIAELATNATELQASLAGGGAPDADKFMALYAVVADTQSRLLRARTGSKERRQDFISFGLTNRLQAQRELLANLERALAVIQQAVEQAGTQAADLKTRMRTTATAVRDGIITAEKQLRRKLQAEEKESIKRAVIISGVAGGFVGGVMGTLHHFGVFDRVLTALGRPTLPVGQATATVTFAASDGESFSALIQENGDIIVKDAAGQAKDLVHLPEGINAHEVIVKPTDGGLGVYEAGSGQPVAMVEMETGTVAANAANLTADQDYALPGGQFVVQADADGAVQIGKVGSGGAIEPIGTKFNLFNPAAQAKLADFPEAVQYQVVPTPGQPEQFVIQSAFDSHTIASFEIAPDGSVVPQPGAPVPAGAVLDRLLADADTKTLLNEMGVQPGELQYNAATKTFTIPDEALRDATTGKAEYLGQTKGWRARRLEFMLKALAEHKGSGETPQMLVARAERATRHLLLESAKYHGDANQAFAEAFDKSDSFIQRSEVPLIDNEVHRRWFSLAKQLQSLPAIDSVTATTVAPSGPGTAAAGAALDIHPLTPEQILLQPGTEQVRAVLDNYGVFDAIELNTRWTTLLATFAAVSDVGGFIESGGVARTTRAATDREFGGGGPVVPETTLEHVSDVAERLRLQRLNETRPERLRLALRRLQDQQRQLTLQTEPYTTRLTQVVNHLRTVGEFTDEDRTFIIDHRTPADQELSRTHNLLSTTEDDLIFADVDRDENASALTQQHDHLADTISHFSEQVLAAYRDQLTMTNTEVDRIAATSHADMPPLEKRRQYQMIHDRVERTRVGISALATEYNWADDDWEDQRTQQQAITEKIDQQYAVLLFDEAVPHPDVRAMIVATLAAYGILEEVGTGLKVKSRLDIFRHLVSKLQTWPTGIAGLQAMGWLDSDKVFGTVEQARVGVVLSKLLTGQDDIFAAGPEADWPDLNPDHPEVLPTAPATAAAVDLGRGNLPDTVAPVVAAEAPAAAAVPATPAVVELSGEADDWA